MIVMMVPTKIHAEELKKPKDFPTEIVNSSKDDKKTEGKIISEIVDKREQNIKYFMKDDFTYEADVDLQYEVRGNVVKENIKINKKLENLEFKFNISLKNIVPKIEKDNSISFYDEKDSKKTCIQHGCPYMPDVITSLETTMGIL